MTTAVAARPFRITDVDAIDREAARGLARRLLDDHRGNTYTARSSFGAVVAESVLQGRVPPLYLAALAILVRADEVHFAVWMERAA